MQKNLCNQFHEAVHFKVVEGIAVPEKEVVFGKIVKCIAVRGEKVRMNNGSSFCFHVKEKFSN